MMNAPVATSRLKNSDLNRIGSAGITAIIHGRMTSAVGAEESGEKMETPKNIPDDPRFEELKRLFMGDCENEKLKPLDLSNPAMTLLVPQTIRIINPRWFAKMRKEVYGISYRAAAEIFGVSAVYLSDVEKGRRTINTESTLGKKIIMAWGDK